MEESEKYPGFMVVNTKYKVDDYVYFNGLSSIDRITCIVKSVDNLADSEDNFEASYTLMDLFNGRITESSMTYYAYESELELNKEMMREREIEKLIGRKPSNRMTEDE